MHMLVVLCAFAFAAVTPFLSALPPSNGDVIQSIDDDDSDPGVDENDTDPSL